MARLRITAPDGVRDVVLKQKLSIGRAEGVDLVLDDKGISRKHCEFEAAGDGFVLRDLASSNGTLVNGEKVTEHRLADGDKIRLGAITITFLTRDADCVLRFGAGEHAGRELPLAAERTTLGRRPDNVIPFVDVKVSGVHLEIVKDGDGFVLRDLGSTNGTFLDGKKVTEVALSNGDRVKIGDSEFTFVDLRKGETAKGAVGAASGAGSSGSLAASAAATAGPDRLSATLPPRKGKLAAVLGLVGVVVAVGAAAAWYFLVAQRDAAPTSGRQAAAAPAGNLLDEEWSFEDSASVTGLWSAELGDGFSSRRGSAASGSYALAASVTGGNAVASRRQAEAIGAANTLQFSGQLEADEGVLASVGLRFLRADGDAAEPRALTLVAAHAEGAGFTKFETEIVPPAWAKRVEVVAVACGEGGAAIDDLALLPGGAPPTGTHIGELALIPRGGGTYVVDHRAPLLELLAPYGSGSVAAAESADDAATPAGGAPTRVDLPPGAFVVKTGLEGTKLTFDPGPAPFAAEGFTALAVPDLAAIGVTLFTTHGAEKRFGAFEEADVSRLLLGSAAERFELALSKPAKIAAYTRGDALELRIATIGPMTVTWRTGFDAERKEASDLLAKAQEDWREGRAGRALSELKEIGDRLPYDERTVEAMRKLTAEILPHLTSELAAIDADAAAADFLGSLERTRKALKRAQDLLVQIEGLEAAKEVAQRVAHMQEKVSAMEREQREEEARRLLRLARAYEAQKSPAPERKSTANELMEELQRSYADTAAAREARGEPAAPAASSGPAAEGGR